MKNKQAILAAIAQTIANDEDLQNRIAENAAALTQTGVSIGEIMEVVNALDFE